jgi:hypothetical protein
VQSVVGSAVGEGHTVPPKRLSVKTLQKEPLLERKNPTYWQNRLMMRSAI